MALLAASRLEQDAREIVGRVVRLLAPAPGRLEFAARLATVCALTALIVEIYGTPDPALTVYVAFFMIRPDRATSVVTDLAFMVIITLVLGVIFLVALVVVDYVPLRVASMALISFGLLFLTSASKLQAVGPIAALIVGYGLDLLGSIPAGEAATRGYLYAWLFVGIPAIVSIVYNMVFGPSPLSLARRTLASRMRTAARALTKPEAKNLEALQSSLREGNAELLQRLRFAALEHAASGDYLKALERASDASIAILSAIDFTLGAPGAMLPRGVRARLARTLNRIAGILGRGGLPDDIEFPAHEDMPAPAAAAYAEIVRTFSEFTETPAPAAPAASKEKTGFLVPDAFSNSMHVYYALKTTMAAMLCYVIYSGLDWPGIHTAFITCYIVSLRTVAETVEKLTLRVAGAMLGAGFGLLTIIFIVPTHDSITDLLVIVFVASLAAGWVAAGSPRISYAGFQFAFAFFLCVIQGAAPSHQLTVARDRVVGIMLGDFVAFVVSTQLWPVSLKSTIESGIANVLRALADLTGASDAAHRRALAGEAQAKLGALEDNVALIAYEPHSIRPPAHWLDLRRHIAQLLAQISPALLIEAEQADTTDISRRLGDIAQHEAPPEPAPAPRGVVGAIVEDKLRALETAVQGATLAQG